ncbi:MAG: DUF3592 domain-containing protein [Tepidisphaera sp.]|jgi:hypothetical protein
MTPARTPGNLLASLHRRRTRKRTVTDFIMLAIFVLMFGGLGVMLIVVGTREHFTQRRLMTSAVPVEARILSVEVKSSTSRDNDTRPLRSTSTTTHLPEVRFEYSIGDTRYESDLLYPTIIHRSYASRESAAEEVREYTPGMTLKAYADPTLPDRGFLRLESTSNPKWFIIAGALSLLFLGLISPFL